MTTTENPTTEDPTDADTTGTSSTDAEAAVVEGYFTCWNTTDPARRAAAIRSTWAPDARLIDPMVDVTGHEQLAETFAAFHETFAGSSFRRLGGIDAHHDHLRWGWEMLDGNGDVALDGIDVALLDDDGRIRYVVGFFGAALPATAPEG